MHAFRATILFTALATSATAQVIGIDDLIPTTGGGPNAFPFSVSTGSTSLHVYSVEALRTRGICSGAALTDLAISCASAASGTFSVSQAVVQIGHLAVSPPVAGNWGGHLDTPITVHDLAAGPYTFPWVGSAHVPLPGFAAANFVWDGARDVGILISFGASPTGTFTLRTSTTQLRHYVAVQNATTQLPTSNGPFAGCRF